MDNIQSISQPVVFQEIQKSFSISQRLVEKQEYAFVNYGYGSSEGTDGSKVVWASTRSGGPFQPVTLPATQNVRVEGNFDNFDNTDIISGQLEITYIPLNSQLERQTIIPITLKPN